MKKPLISTQNGPEIRFAEGQKVGLEYRAAAESEPKVPEYFVGKAIVCGVRSKNLGGFVEIIDKEALKDADLSDVKGLFNHDRNYVLGTISAGTLELTVDADGGLSYRIKYDHLDPDHVRVMRKIERGDVVGSSFAFRVAPNGADWDYDEEGMYVRTVTKISRVSDVCPVTDPAYADTEAAQRSLGDYQQQRAKPAGPSLDQRRRQLALLAHAPQ
ncbi:HK97 family phage prohead protease [Hymenobacter negativus]|uniref:HK97 family phage prohead protease n=1 Tax=Hymenobacter negativus TaxID=2795026 RepID=A0ABS0Q948_9BACT|nr:HK97 family phage prohead protease [Hymenobacter negativus]MBH8558987.1 HK97 family phage prohead protease [Hymenobacter negativus]